MFGSLRYPKPPLSPAWGIPLSLTKGRLALSKLLGTKEGEGLFASSNSSLHIEKPPLHSRLMSRWARVPWLCPAFQAPMLGSNCPASGNNRHSHVARGMCKCSLQLQEV